MSELEQRVKALALEARENISRAQSLESLNDLRVAVLGKKGTLTAILKSMKDVAPEERPKVGQWVNDARIAVEKDLEETKKRLEEAKRAAALASETLDVTLPPRQIALGHTHPCTIALEEVERIFIGMGYEVVEGPEIEYDEYNFGKLNIPEGHPAKDEQDTFYITKDILLRT